MAAIADERHQDDDGRDWKPGRREEGRLLLSTLGHRGCLQVESSAKYFNISLCCMFFSSDTSTGKSSRREQSWTPAWVCAILKPATEHSLEGDCFQIVLEPGTIDLDVHVDLANIFVLNPLSDGG